MAPSRAFLGALVRDSFDINNAISPFSEETNQIREESINLFRAAIDSSPGNIHPRTAPHLPRLLWFLQMGIILHWLIDESTKQEHTDVMLEQLTGLIFTLLKIQRLPFMGGVNRRLFALLDHVFWPIK